MFFFKWQKLYLIHTTTRVINKLVFCIFYDTVFSWRCLEKILLKFRIDSVCSESFSFYFSLQWKSFNISMWLQISSNYHIKKRLSLNWHVVQTNANIFSFRQVGSIWTESLSGMPPLSRHTLSEAEGAVAFTNHGPVLHL